MWHSDIGSVVEADIGKGHWTAFRAEADKRSPCRRAQEQRPPHRPELALAWDARKRSANPERLCTEINT